MMGRSYKYSKGHSSGFVPDYRHAVETMGESEGFGSSIRLDTEMTVSGDSFAPKRKSINLNVDGYDGFGVPMQVLSVSRMSRSEKKNLEAKLKVELEQVRILQKKIANLASNVVVFSPASEIRSCSDGQRKPSVENFNKLTEVSAPGKKRPPPARTGSQTKRSSSGRSQPVKATAPPSTTNAVSMKQCENLLNRLLTHQFAWVFNAPVDIVKLNIPDYFTVIKKPMDLGTIKVKLTSGEYSSPVEFADDVRLTFSNALTYNPAGNDVHIMADTMRKYFEVRWKPIEKKLQLATGVQTKPSLIELDTETIIPSPPLKKKKVASTTDSNLLRPELKPEPVKQIITEEEKQKLGSELEELLGELPESIVNFLKEHTQGQPDDDGEIEIDIDALSDDTLVSLRKLLDGYLQEKQANQEKAEPCEIELPNESGFSNSSAQPCKGNEPADEEIDIVGGNNVPVSSFPPVEIEKDASHRNSKPGSPSSSSSESGSSSSDSDSGSSSESECDMPKASVLPGPTMENPNSGASPDPMGKSSELFDTGVANLGDSEVANPEDSELANPGESELANPEESELANPEDTERENLGDSEMGNPSVPEVAQGAEGSQSKPTFDDTDGVDDRQEGEEGTPPEKPVSPEKQYRAALLKNRFADTILKAREKALEKTEKQDPEQLQKEKEELERRQKEEKARLQAEATAAAEARKKAEQQAAAEAKRKRELEREAARKALQMMEKTVEINENCQFMQDLEMLRTAANDEELPSFEEEASPELSQNGLGSFKLKGNPLEKLGLYMKMDDEFEEEEIPEIELPQEIPESEPPQEVSESEPPLEVSESEPPLEVSEIPEQPNDVEEGEID